MIDVIFEKWSNLILTIILIILAGVILLLLVDMDNTKMIIKKIIDYMPLFVPDNIKNDINDKIINIMINIKNNSDIIPKEIVREIVRYIPEETIRAGTAGLPDSIIDESKCKRIVKDDKFKDGIEVAIPDNLPWDEKVNYCDSNNWDVEDIDLDNFIFASSKRKSRIFLY
jgi:hypothetical protein